MCRLPRNDGSLKLLDPNGPIWHVMGNLSNLISLTAISLLTLFLTLCVQSNLGSRTPRIMNNSVYEQIFRTQSVSNDVLCLELRTRKPSTSWKNRQKKEKESPSKQHFTSSPPSTYAVNSPPYRYGKTKLRFRLYLICLVFCLSFL